MQKIFVVSVIPSAETAGTELSVLNSSILFQENGIENQIWTLSSSSKFDKYCTQNNVVLRKFPITKSHPLKSLLSLIRICKSAYQIRKCYVFHFYLPKAYLVGLFLRKTIGIKYILGVRGRINHRGFFVEKMLQSAFRSAESIVCNAQHLIPVVRMRFNLKHDNIFCVTNMVKQKPVAEFQTYKKFDQVTAVVLSNFIEYKGHLFLLEALASLDKPPNVILIGNGTFEVKVREKIHNLGLQSCVTILSNADVEKVLPKCHFAIHPSETEGLSNAMLEEISFGLPVIAFNVGGNGEIIRNNINGFLLERRELKYFSNAIEILSRNQNLRNQMGWNALEVSKNFSPEKYLRNILTIYLNKSEK